MKKVLLAVIALSGAMACFAQVDTSAKDRVDTIKIGGMVIIKKRGSETKGPRQIEISKGKKKNANLTTNWHIVDIGFANFNDNSNYAAAQASGFLGAGVGEDQFDLRTGKSVNINYWLFMQRLNVIKHVVNLKYGLGLELNNYRFDDERVRFSKNPTQINIDPALASVKKNKLAADYVTVPVMLNFNFTPRNKRGFGLSAGVSAGYLYSARQKIKNNGDKDKLHDDFDLRKWKLSYIGELSLGPVKLYGSYAMKSMWEKALDQTPYAVGIRISSM
jgi:hypothetical protein